MDNSAKRAVCTIITKSFISQARVLAQNLKDHDRGLEFWVLLADRLNGEFDPAKEPFKLIQLGELKDQAAIHRMAFYYSPFEFCCALRPYFHEYLAERGLEEWIFLDGDTLVFGSLEKVFEELRGAEVLLTPHFNEVKDDDKIIEKFESKVMKYGLYNAGFLAMRNTSETRKFIYWWKRRLEKYCFFNTKAGLFVDQLWLMYAPHFFAGIKSFKHPGVNTAYWNLRERTLNEDSAGRLLSNGEPLISYHFSGWQLEKPENITKLTRFYDNYQDPVWKKISLMYKASLIKHGYFETKDYLYAFSRFKSGEIITSEMRTYYFELLKSGAQIGDPFERAALFTKKFQPNKEKPFWTRLHLYLYRIKQAVIQGVKNF